MSRVTQSSARVGAARSAPTPFSPPSTNAPKNPPQTTLVMILGQSVDSLIATRQMLSSIENKIFGQEGDDAPNAPTPSNANGCALTVRDLAEDIMCRLQLIDERLR
jgi:hypothetical protein